MKKLIFIDNDNIEGSNKVVKDYVIPMLSAYGNIEIKSISDIEIISDLYEKRKDDLYALFYSGANAILSWSVYTPSSMHNSYLQLLHFLRVAGSANVKNIVYLDMSGMVEKALLKLRYQDTKDLFFILSAIENNKIVTLKDGEFIRLQLDFTKEELFKHETVSITELLEIV